MTRMSPRTSLHSSKFIRCLADLGMAQAFAPEHAFAEKLGLWIHFTDAIPLAAVHGDSGGAPPKKPFGMPADDRRAVGAEFERVQASLTDSILKSCSPSPGRMHLRLPDPVCELPLDVATAYPPYRRFYEAHQRDMELRIVPLRANVREALAQLSPGLSKLAELDATFEKILRERESKLLSTVPLLLGKRFEQLFNQHQQRLLDARQADDPVRWTQAGGWLARFCSDLQMLLLAEMELRLQPALGLIEAFKQDTQ